MSLQFNYPRTPAYSNVAEAFQRAGYTTLIFDPRSIGASDGEPLNEINPAQQTEDLHDAVSFLKGQPSVDPRRIGVLGFSLSADVALAAAAFDRRIGLVIAIVPAAPTMSISSVRERCMRDRESRLRGNAPFAIPYFGVGQADHAMMSFSYFRGVENASIEDLQMFFERIPNFRNRVGTQTFYHMATWPFLDMLQYVSPTPVLQIDAGAEEMDVVKQGRQEVFDRLGEPKELHVEPGRGHIDIMLYDEHWEALINRMIKFMRKHFEGEDE